MTDSNNLLYTNRISQTMDILRPHEDRLIYPIFHFIPGDPKAPSAARVDGRTDPWVTTPNSALANQMIDAALASNDLYRIGVSAHGYVDTWAHQNFLGKRDSFNEFAKSLFADITEHFMAVGHAHAKHNPDWPALSWDDTRLVEPHIVNRVRFLDAASHLYRKFARHLDPATSDAVLEATCASLVDDLDADIGVPDNANLQVAARIERYVARSLTAPYGGVAIPLYGVGEWFAEAIEENRDAVNADAVAASASSLLRDLKSFAGDVLADSRRPQVTWRNPDAAVYQKYHWYRFQEAVKGHLDECEAMLVSAGVLTAT
jgi:hypothetical protein